jgi:hypothetical protein
MQDDLCPLVFAARVLERSATGSYGKPWYEALFITDTNESLLILIDSQKSIEHNKNFF